MKILGMCSSYMEGALVQGAIRSLLTACDHVLVMEGPAGPPVEGCPPSELGLPYNRVTIQEGRWRTDARKRQAMLEWAQRWHTDPHVPLWGVIVDADEVLFNGEYVRDWLQALVWAEEADPTRQTEFLGKPLRLIELDGGVSWARARLLRLDRIRTYEVSTSMFTNHRGIRHGEGNVPDKYSEWAEPRASYFEGDVMLCHPPIPGEPHLLHRSGLRHPARRGVRMHEQEASELAIDKERAGVA